MSFSDRVQTASAANAKFPQVIPALVYAGVIQSMSWPGEDDEFKSFTDKDSGKEVEYFMAAIKVKLSGPIGDMEVEPEDQEVIDAELPRSFTFNVMINENNLDTTGLMMHQQLIYDALGLGDKDKDLEEGKPVKDYFEELIGQEVGVETRIRDYKTKEGEPRQSTELGGFHAI